jgi:hypothetical protein
MSLADISPAVSIIALGVSLFTLWFTVLRRGSIRCTRPSFVAIRYDFVSKPQAQAKVFFRSLLFSTGKRGVMIEQLFLRVSEGSRQTEFSFWGYGDDKLLRGSGLFVPETGVTTNHHFNPTDASTLFRFSGGTYSFELLASLVGRNRLVSLWTIELEVPGGIFDDAISANKAIFYNWSPQTQSYVKSVEERFDSDTQSPPRGDWRRDGDGRG